MIWIDFKLKNNLAIYKILLFFLNGYLLKKVNLIIYLMNKNDNNIR